MNNSDSLHSALLQCIDRYGMSWIATRQAKINGQDDERVLLVELDEMCKLLDEIKDKISILRQCVDAGAGGDVEAMRCSLLASIRRLSKIISNFEDFGDYYQRVNHHVKCLAHMSTPEHNPVIGTFHPRNSMYIHTVVTPHDDSGQDLEHSETYIDAALITLNDDFIRQLNPPFGRIQMQSEHPNSDQNVHVHKLGFSTGLTHGTLLFDDVAVADLTNKMRVALPFHPHTLDTRRHMFWFVKEAVQELDRELYPCRLCAGQYVIANLKPGDFADAGDSGSLVLDSDSNAVGLLHGALIGGVKYLGVVTPIQYVCDALHITEIMMPQIMC